MTVNKTLIGAACVAIFLLLGGGATVLLQLEAPSNQLSGATTAPTEVTAASTTVPADAWRERFTQVYRLDDGQILKRIAPPFIPERDQYYRSEHEFQAGLIPQAPEYFTFHWDGKELKNWGLGFTSRNTVRGVLMSSLSMNTFEFEAPDNLLSYGIRGDWTVRPGAPTGDILDALCAIIRQDGGPSMRFTNQNVLRTVLVAGGKYSFHPLANTFDARGVHMYVDTPDENEGAGGGSGDIGRFLQVVGSRMGLRIVDQVQGERPTTLTWYHHRSSYLDKLPRGQDRDEKTIKVLDLLSQQTELQFKIETRIVPVWIAAPTP